MKKTLLIAGMIAAPISMAVAKTINFDTPVEWNSKVVEQALNKAGFIGGSGANWDVRVTHDRIFAEMLRQKEVSLNDAAKVCLAQCLKSDFLRNGRGASGKKCPDLCDAFTNALYSINNSSKSAGKSASNSAQTQPDGTTKIWSADKKYYVLYDKSSVWDTPKSLQKYTNICNWNDTVVAVVFEAQSNQPIALLSQYSFDGHRGYLEKECAIKKYDGFKISFEYLNNKLTLQDKADILKKKNQEIYVSYKEDAKKLQQALASVPTLSAVAKKYGGTDADYYANKITEARNLLNRYNRITSVDSNTNVKDFYLMKRMAEEIESFPKYIEILNECVAELVQMNGQTIDYSNIQTKTDEEAYEVARRRMNTCEMGRMVYADWKSQISCKTTYYSSLLGKDDKIQCIYKDITVTFIFDDIRNTSIFD